MEIILIRHGKSAWQKSGWINPAQFAQWIAAYDAHGISVDDPIPELTVQKMKQANVVITSPLPRALHSVQRLLPACLVEENELFREVDTPIAFLHLHFLRLPVQLWLIFARLCWFLGYVRGVESYAQAVTRAQKACDLLMEYSEKYGTVAVVGHGWFHRFVGKQLEKKDGNELFPSERRIGTHVRIH
ncbi:histidine phosphatase family protein [Anoxybacteroides amylolyticum]|uniref:Histidine phosphatase super family protein n=1 Tax=Anoxybacteroides amylolyticum TaxID=294699 RepID=A0A160F344_9BACL|nr:histidine phosphatase family protein [Anoxybacillus amylolyticus]ANB59973.1 histidine phosphatase super family protein [Anoxybacillus amylolyticus]